GRTALDRQRLEPRLAEIGLQDEAVVPGAENDAVVSGHAMRAALRASRVERPTQRAANSVCSLPPWGGGVGRGVVVVAGGVSSNTDPHPQPLPTRGRGAH